MNTTLRNSDKLDFRGYTILIIDDEPANLGVMSDYLEGFGFRALVARDGESGLERAQHAWPDLILLDVSMPGMDGFEACRRLKADENTKDIPVIFMTALAETEHKIKGFQLGAVDYVTKPFQAEELLARITTHLHLRDLTECLEQKVRERTDALLESEERYRGLFEGVPVGIYRTTPAGQFLDVNQALVQMLGYPDRETLLAENAADLYVSREAHEQWQAQIIREGVVRNFRIQARRRDGETIWVKDTGRVVRDTNGQVLHYEGSLEDITKRVRMEEEARAARQQLLDIIDFLPDAAFVIDQDKKVIAWNQAIEKMTGLRKEDILGQGDYAYAVPFYGQRRPIVIDLIGAENSEVRSEYDYVHKQGNTLYAEAFVPSVFEGRGAYLWMTASPLLDSEGNQVGAIESIRDITDRKQAEKKIRQRNRELTLLNRVIAASMTETRTEAILEMTCRELAAAFDVPQAAALLVNEERTELVVVAEYLAKGQPVGLNESTPVEGNPLALALLTRKAPMMVKDAQNDPHLVQFHDLLRRRGAVSLLIVPLVSGDEGVGGLWLEAIEPRNFSAEEVGLAWSVAYQAAGALARIRLDQERQQLEARYYQAQKMEAIGMLAGGIAHDFNNLLTAINGFAELVQRRLQSDDPLWEMVNIIFQSGQRAAGLVRQLLVFSRKQVIKPQVLELDGVVIEMEKMLRRIIGEHIQMETNLSPELWSVKVDPAQIEQVIVNLAVNARDAMPDGGRLTIELANMRLDEDDITGHLDVQPGEYVLLVVSDSGCGMNDEVKAHLFEPFFTTKEKDKGTGLGLATVFGIVKQSGGDIWVSSEEGVGATFKIYLPRAVETGQNRSRLKAEADLPSGSETILLVEDDAGVRGLARRVLQAQGYFVLEAPDGQEAVEVAKRHTDPIHLLLTDMVMPGMSGQELAEQLTQIQPDLKTLFISGYTDQVITSPDQLESDVAFLQKPFDPSALAHKVRAVLDGLIVVWR
jgi:PAS domain S-box-containing protein